MSGLKDLSLDFSSPTAASSAQLNTFKSPTGQVIQKTNTGSSVPVKTTTPTTKTTTSGGGGTPTNTTTTTNTNNFDPDAERRAREEAERQRQIERENQIRSNISSAYEPIFSELDRQLGLVPGQRSELEGQVSNLATQQKEDAEFEKGQRLKEVEGYRVDEQNRAKSSFQELGDNIRNILQASAFYLGAKGANDSSATQAASEAIAQAANKTKGKLLATRDDALRQLDQKAIQIGDLATQQLKKIDDWKGNKMFEVAQWAADRINTLNSQKATAAGEKARAIAQLIENTQQQFTDYLRKLDSDVYNYKQTVGLWQQQRAAELEDYKTKLGLSAQYSSGTAQQYKVTNDGFGNLLQYDSSDPAGTIQQIYGYGNTGATTEEKPRGIIESLFGTPEEDVRTQVQF